MTRFDFEKRIKDAKEKEAKLKKQSDRMSTIRLVEFLSGVAIAFFCFRQVGSLAGWLAVLAALVLFVILVRKHQKMNMELDLTRSLVLVNQEYLDRITGDWSKFSDRGNEFVDPDHPYTSDLDIFGEQSLFQAINTAKTWYGRNRLAERLRRPMKDASQITEQQNAVMELPQKLDFCQALQCEGILNKKAGEDPRGLIAYAEDGETLMKRKWLENLFTFFPAITLVSLAFSILNLGMPPVVPGGMILIQLVIMAFEVRVTHPVFSRVAGFKKAIMAYGNIIRRIEDEEFSDPVLAGCKSRLAGEGKKTSLRLKKLESISEAMDIRFSPMIHFFLNLFLLWDFQCIFALEDWKKKNGPLLRGWLETIGEFEVLSSLAVIPVIHPDWAYPSCSQSTPSFTATALGHPLIHDDKRVCNDMTLTDRILVITGSNMSGKTTMLRTVGINLVLAFAGAPVCAAEMVCSVMDIHTSMRISDDLGNGISTFYAELLRMKTIVERSRLRENMIFLIDEIFRGTNSTDRTVGAVRVLKALNKSWIIGLISTHDFELCELENQDKGRIRNYHFTEKYSSNQVIFDYKLYPGRSETTNAAFLMRMVGIE